MANDYVRVRGMRYRCRLRLGSVDGLDPLAEFFHSEVLDREPRIKILVDSFGLPPRVIEDVLADLLKRGYAALNAPKGEIIKLRDSGRGRREFRLAGELRVWQDSLTGALLPATAVELYRSHPDKVRLTDLVGRTHAALGFMEAPDAHIISELGNTDPQLAVQEAGWIPDSLIDKERIDTLEVFLPVSAAETDGSVVRFVDARTLPSWLTRQWSRALQPGGAITSAGTFAQVLSTVKNDSASSREGNVFSRVNIQYLVDGFQASFFTLLRMSPPPTRRSQAYDLESKHAELQMRIETSGRTGLHAPTGKSHIRELWESTEAYLIVCLRTLDRNIVQPIVSATIGPNSRSGYLIIVGPSPSGIHNQPAETESYSGDVIVLCTNQRVGPECCIRDGIEARFGTAKKLLGNDSVLRVTGRGALEVLLGDLSQLVHGQPGAAWVSRRVWQEGRRSSMSHQLLDVSSRLAAAVETLKANIGRNDEAAVATGDPGGTLGERLPELCDAIETLCFSLPGRFAEIADPYFSTEGRTFAEIIAEALADSVAQGGAKQSLFLVSHDWNRQASNSELPSLLQKCTAQHMRIQIIVAGVERREDAEARLGTLKELIGQSGISMWRCARYLPDMVLFENYIVVLFGSGLDQSSRGGFLTVSARAATELRGIATHAI